MWWLLGLWWLSQQKKKTEPGATGPSVEARSGKGHFAPKPGATGPATQTRNGRGHF